MDYYNLGISESKTSFLRNGIGLKTEQCKDEPGNYKMKIVLVFLLIFRERNVIIRSCYTGILRVGVI